MTQQASSVLPFPVQPDAPHANNTPWERRHSVVEPAVGGAYRLVYRDEDGYPLLSWVCDMRVPEKTRDWLQSVQQRIGDELPALAARAPSVGVRLMP